MVFVMNVLAHCQLSVLGDTVWCAWMYCVVCFDILCRVLGYTVSCAWVYCVVRLGMLCRVLGYTL